MLTTTNIEARKSNERLHVIDALRGFALLGIILVHSAQQFPDSYNTTKIDNIVNLIILHLFSGRSFTIFCFLFGFGLALQVDSARKKLQPFLGPYCWRLFILFIIGYLHAQLYPGDILQTYALLGFIVAFSIKLSNNQLLVLASVLYACGIFTEFYTVELSNIVKPITSASESSKALQFLLFHKLKDLIWSNRLFTIPALFVLGLFAGRKKLFIDTEENLVLWRRILIWSTFAVTFTTLIYYVDKLIGTASVHNQNTLYSLRQITQSTFYVAIITYLFQRKVFKKIVSYLLPIGQMGLTIYLMQSIILKLYYGLAPDSILNMGRATSIGITIIFFIVQIIFAAWWMSHFRYGPIEWLWRSLTHCQWQPILRRTEKPIMDYA